MTTTPPPSSLASVGSNSPINLHEDVFKSHMDAATINRRYFNIQTSNIAKRMAHLEGLGTRVRQHTGTPNERQGDKCAHLEPHPLNSTLDHTMSDEEMQQRKAREMGQYQRLSRLVDGSPQILRQRDSEPLLICMVGLPARGKTYTSRRIMRYLAWLGVQCQVFNVSIYRRKNVGFPSAEFFDQSNPEFSSKLMEVFDQALDDLATWINEGGQVAIFDGTTHTRARRARVISHLESTTALTRDRMMFIEMQDICGGSTDCITERTVASMPEYIGRDVAEANEDFERRLKFYAAAYEELSREEGVPFVKCGKQSLQIHRMNGYLTGRLTFLLMNLKVMHRNVFLTLTGKEEEPEQAAPEEDGVVGRPEKPSVVEGPARAVKKAESAAALTDSMHLRAALQSISQTGNFEPEGVAFSQALVGLLRATIPANEPVTVWTSSNPAGTETVKYLEANGYPTVYWRYLAEFGFSVVQKMMGETYEDIIERLEPVIFEIERCETHLFIIGNGR
eukprot:gene19125-29457_t